MTIDVMGELFVWIFFFVVFFFCIGCQGVYNSFYYLYKRCKHVYQKQNDYSSY